MRLPAKLLAIIKREYLQQVTAKAFWISTLLIPTIGLSFIYLQVVLAKTVVSSGKIGVVDVSGRLFQPLLEEQRKAAAEDSDEDAPTKKEDAKPEGRPDRTRGRIELVEIDATKETLAATRTRLNAEVQASKLKAYIVLDGKTLETGVAEWRASSVKADVITRNLLATLLSRAVTKERLKDRGVDPKLYDAARIRVDLDPHEAKDKESAESSKDFGFNLAVSGIFFFLIYFSIFFYGGFVMRGVLEEKNNRIVEVIVSSVRPTHLMLGKIIGIGLVGLSQYSIWGVVALNLSLPGLMGVMGVSGLDAVPPIPLGTIGAFVLFFLLGYFLYASLYAALAAPFNTEQEAQQFVMIPSMLLVFTSMTWFLVFNNPSGPLAITLSLFPFTAPLMMFMRISVQTPPAWQIALSVTLTSLAIWGMAWVAGRIYRVGILMYGKRPTLPEIVRWAARAE